MTNIVNIITVNLYFGYVFDDIVDAFVYDTLLIVYDNYCQVRGLLLRICSAFIKY